MTHGVATSHAQPQSFLRRYVFSVDHKVIGRQYLDLALVAVVTGMVLSWNGGATALFGWTEAEAVGQVLPFVTAERMAVSSVQNVLDFFAGRLDSDLIVNKDF